MLGRIAAYLPWRLSGHRMSGRPFADAIRSRSGGKLPAADLDFVGRVAALVEAGASVDAALALVEYELPDWEIRRLARENGKWTCALARDGRLPAEPEAVVEGDGDSAPQAIVHAMAEVRNMEEAKAGCRASHASPAGAGPACSFQVSCDDYR